MPSQHIGVGTAVLTTIASDIGIGDVVSIALQADPTNGTDILIGNSENQVIRLTPGASITLNHVNLRDIYARAVSGTPTVNWIARRY